MMNEKSCPLCGNSYEHSQYHIICLNCEDELHEKENEKKAIDLELDNELMLKLYKNAKEQNITVDELINVMLRTFIC